MVRNPLKESLQSGRFCHMVEIVASRISREARLLEVASQLAVTPGVVAGSITSYAGGSAGQDPLRVGCPLGAVSAVNHPLPALHKPPPTAGTSSKPVPGRDYGSGTVKVRSPWW